MTPAQTTDSVADEPQSAVAPPRPSFKTGLPEVVEATEPARIKAVAGWVFASALALLVSALYFWQNASDVHAELVRQLAKEAEDYSASQVSKAVTYALGAVAAARVLLVAGQLLAVRKMFQRRRGGRTSLIVITLFSVPAVAVTYLLVNQGDTINTIMFVIQALALVIASVIALTHPVSKWLHVREPVAHEIFPNEEPGTDDENADDRDEGSVNQDSNGQDSAAEPSAGQDDDRAQ